MSSLATAPRPAQSRPDRAADRTRLRRFGVTGDAALGLVLAGGLALLAFLTSGGTDLAPNTWVQIGLIAVAAGLAVTVAVSGARGPAWGATSLLLFAGLAALTVASIGWSVQPATSWLEANRTLSYLAAFAAALAAARVFPARWPAVLGGIAAAATVLAGYALLVKVFPASFDPTDVVARLRAPFDYWNATGLIAAMGLPACVWAGARRESSRILRALSVPAIGVLVVVLILSYSRGALAGAVLGLACWFVLVPLRLRGALVLGLGAAGGAAVAAWALGVPALANDYISLHERGVAGHHLGIALLIMLAVLTASGFAAAGAMARIVLPPRLRRGIGIGLLALLGLLPVAGLVALASSTRGLTGEISHAWTTVTDPNSVVYETPGRLAELGSSRPRYWNEGVEVAEHALLKGVGARGFGTARPHYATDPLPVSDAHSYVVETFADLGVIGLALSLALLVAWAFAVRRALVAPGGRAREWLAERAGLSALLAIALIFGVSSAIDWTWFVPGVAVPAMLCAGWLVGRGPPSAPVGRTARRRLTAVPASGAAAVAAVAIAVTAGWFVWQPLRSADADAAATKAILAGDSEAALADARSAVASDPVSSDALSELSAIYVALGNLIAGRAELARATVVQPANPATWIALAQFDLQHGQAALALRDLRRALPLNPRSSEIRRLMAQAGGQLHRG